MVYHIEMDAVVSAEAAAEAVERAFVSFGAKDAAMPPAAEGGGDGDAYHPATDDEDDDADVADDASRAAAADQGLQTAAERRSAAESVRGGEESGDAMRDTNGGAGGTAAEAEAQGGVPVWTAGSDHDYDNGHGSSSSSASSSDETDGDTDRNAAADDEHRGHYSGPLHLLDEASPVAPSGTFSSGSSSGAAMNTGAEDYSRPLGGGHQVHEEALLPSWLLQNAARDSRKLRRRLQESDQEHNWTQDQKSRAARKRTRASASATASTSTFLPPWREDSDVPGGDNSDRLLLAEAGAAAAAETAGDHVFTGKAHDSTVSHSGSGDGSGGSDSNSKAVVSEPAATFPGVGGMPPIGHNPEASSLASTSGVGNLVAEITSYVLLFLLIFGMSATVDMRNLLRQLKNKFAIGTGVAMQFLVMPFLGFVAVTALKKHGFESHMGLTLLIVTASPGGSYSNWWCSTFNADLALSVAMTALSTLLSTVLLPANLMLYANAAYGLSGEGGGILSHVDWSSLFISLGVVIVAILSGLLASYKIHSRRFRRWSNRLGTFSGIALIVFSAAFSTGTGSSEASLWGQDWSFYVGVGLPCLVGLVVANFLSRLFRLKKPEVVTLSVECCYQNVGIATSAAMAMFDDPIQRAEALCVPLFYGFVEAAILGLYCVVSWKMGWTKAPADEKLCVVIGTTYEVAVGDVDEDTQMAEEGGDHDLRLDEMVVDEEDGLGSLPGSSRGNRSRAGTADSWGSRSSQLMAFLSPNRQRTRSADRFSDNDIAAAVTVTPAQTMQLAETTFAAPDSSAAPPSPPLSPSAATTPRSSNRARTGTEERVESHYSARWLGTIVAFFSRGGNRRRRHSSSRQAEAELAQDGGLEGRSNSVIKSSPDNDKKKDIQGRVGGALALAKSPNGKDHARDNGCCEDPNRSRTRTECTELTDASVFSDTPEVNVQTTGHWNGSLTKAIPEGAMAPSTAAVAAASASSSLGQPYGLTLPAPYPSPGREIALVLPPMTPPRLEREIPPPPHGAALEMTPSHDSDAGSVASVASESSTGSITRATSIMAGAMLPRRESRDTMSEGGGGGSKCSSRKSSFDDRIE